MRTIDHSYINGRFVRPHGTERLDLISPVGAAELHSLKFVSEGANALLVGKPGTGKSHIAKAMAWPTPLSAPSCSRTGSLRTYCCWTICS